MTTPDDSSWITYRQLRAVTVMLATIAVPFIFQALTLVMSASTELSGSDGPLKTESRSVPTKWT